MLTTYKYIFIQIQMIIDPYVFFLNITRPANIFLTFTQSLLGLIKMKLPGTKQIWIPSQRNFHINLVSRELITPDSELPF